MYQISTTMTAAPDRDVESGLDPSPPQAAETKSKPHRHHHHKKKHRHHHHHHHHKNKSGHRSRHHHGRHEHKRETAEQLELLPGQEDDMIYNQERHDVTKKEPETVTVPQPITNTTSSPSLAPIPESSSSSSLGGVFIDRRRTSSRTIPRDDSFGEAVKTPPKDEEEAGNAILDQDKKATYLYETNGANNGQKKDKKNLYDKIVEAVDTMFGVLNPEVSEPDPDELEDDIPQSSDDIREPEPLSWRLSDIDAQVADKGWENRGVNKYKNFKIVLQVALSIFYAIIYGTSFLGFNPYYEWPLREADTTSTTTYRVEVGIDSIMTDEEYFVCEGKTFYANGTGPLQDYESYVEYVSGNYGLLKSMGIYWGISIAFFVAAIIFKLYSGKYNQLLLLVKFKKDEKDNVLKPAKLSFAYTIMCNAKSFYNVVFIPLCERAAWPENLSPQGSEWLSLIFVLCWCLMMLWILRWVFTCGECCGQLSKLPWYLGGCGRESTYRWFRGLVICNTFIMFLTWIINFNPSIQFNLRYPVLCFANVVSWVDLALSFIGDAYYGNYCSYLENYCCKHSESRGANNEDIDKSRSTDTDVESPSSNDDESGKSSFSNHCKNHPSSSAKRTSHKTTTEEESTFQLVGETVQEYIYPDGSRLSVKTMTYPDGSKRVVETVDRPN